MCRHIINSVWLVHTDTSCGLLTHKSVRRQLKTKYVANYLWNSMCLCASVCVTAERLRFHCQTEPTDLHS